MSIFFRFTPEIIRLIVTNMKTTISTLIFTLCFSCFLKGQEYQYVPLVNEEFTWSYCDVVRVGINEYDLSYFHFQIKGDTIINNVSYKKIYGDCSSYPTNYVAAIREEDKKVYVVRPNEQQEKLTYDFNAEVGDCVVVDGDYCHYKVSKIDLVEIDGKLRKRFDNFIIEGIGILGGFFMFPSDPVLLYEIGMCFNYQKKGEEIIYKTDEWYFNEKDCNASAIENISNNRFHFLHQNIPNPFTQRTQINFYIPENVKTAQICIYNLQGKQIKQIPVTQRGEGSQWISGSELTAGMYLYTLIMDGKEVDTKQMILTK